MKGYFEVNTVNYRNKSNLNILDWKTVQKETQKDKILCDILRFSIDGWLLKNDIGENYEP